ncbi:MAG: DUF4236 domain-containing protein [Azospirillum sp.]|nr:DUF4236 domain-containing protein [Azospirillum sp.]
MGLRFQKSINLGAGFKINLSKSGIGYSWGIPGFRKTKLCNGRKRTTFNIPGTGISYIKEKRKADTKPTDTSKTNTEQKNIDLETFIDNEIATEDSLISDIKLCLANRSKIKIYVLLSFFIISLICIFSASSLLAEKTAIAIMCTVLLWRTLPLSFFSFLIPFVCGVIIEKNSNTAFDSGAMVGSSVVLSLFLSFITKLIEVFLQNIIVEPVKLNYDLDEAYKSLYDDGIYAINLLNSNDKIWLNSVGGTNVSIKKGLPDFIEADINCYYLSVGALTIYFLPDRCLLVSGSKVSSVSYKDISYKISKLNVSEAKQASDALFVGERWKYSKVNGERDNRYKDNRSTPVYQYAEFIVYFGNKKLILCCSSIEKTTKLIQWIERIKYQYKYC